MSKTGIIEGMCPSCCEYTEVSFEDNGCCDSGAESEGHIYTYEDFEEEEPIITIDNIKEGNTNETNN